jgi:putative aldouronate transport system substrate-binding protein
MKKLLSFFLAAVLMLSITACSGDTQNKDSGKDHTGTKTDTVNQSGEAHDSKDPFLTGEKPELKALLYHTVFDMAEQPSNKLIEEITGYKVKWFNLPQENPDEKLLLEISGGTNYDILMKMTSGQTNQLYVQNALYDLKPYLDKYGADIYSGISEMALESFTDENGMIYAMPYEEGSATKENPYGAFLGGIGFNANYLNDINMEVPTNLEDFYNVLKAYTNKTNKPAYTQVATAWNNAILTAFGMGDPGWYEVDGEYVPRIKHPGTVKYLAFMQKLYKEGLLDNDFPINTGNTVKEKFTNGTVLAYPVMFWDIDGIYDAFKAAGNDAKVEVSPCLTPDKDSKATVYLGQGIENTACIPKTSQNPEHAVIWLNMLSNPDNFKRIYIGEEGVSYEVKDENYYPVFPAFNDYLNSDKFVGVARGDDKFKMWQARARKTEVMAGMYEQMNANIDKYEYQEFFESYASSIDAVQKNQTALNTMVDDKLIQAIAGEENPQTAVDNIIAEWDKTGGKEYEASMQKWYIENKDTMKE